MVNGMIGKKLGMTQLFAKDGLVTPVTVLQVGPCVVVQRRTDAKDGYDAIQLGLVDAGAVRHANKPQQGHHKKAGVPPTRLLKEFRAAEGADPKPGESVLVDMFDDVAKVDIEGTSLGKGFQGVIKRHGFGGGKASHGSMHHRAPGSIGMSAFPGKVLKGRRGPGQMGNVRVTLKNVVVVRIDAEKNLMLVRGSVPGAKGSTVLIRKSKSNPPAAVAG